MQWLAEWPAWLENGGLWDEVRADGGGSGCQAGGFGISPVGSEEPWKIHELRECHEPVYLGKLGEVSEVLP